MKMLEKGLGAAFNLHSVYLMMPDLNSCIKTGLPIEILQSKYPKAKFVRTLTCEEGKTY